MAWAKQHRERQKSTRFDAFCRSFDGVRFWPLQDRASHFCDYFMINFLRFWTFFASMAWAKQNRERQKWMRFDAFSQVKRRRVFFAVARPCSIFFRAHFAVIFVHFGVILRDFAYPSKSMFKVYEWPMKQFRICNFHHFWSVFDTGKIEVAETLGEFSEKWW